MKNFVFVLGAGASVDLNLPIGSQLTGQIRNALSFKTDGFHVTGGEPNLRVALQASGMEANEWFSASQLIADSMPLAPSIDNFVDVHRNDPTVATCAKVAITQCILKAERNSTIYVDPSNMFNTINFQKNINAWHTLFFRILTTNCVLADLPARVRSIGVISFNYDRCFEHFLLHAISAYYKIPRSEAAGILMQLEVFHPYGLVGTLPNLTPDASVEYGEEISPRRLLEISKQIKTFTESIDEEASSIIRIREMAFNARNLVFLGFAFHSINVRLIFPFVSSEPTNYGKRIIATALNSSQSDLRIILSDLHGRYKCDSNAIELRKDLTCSALFNEYSRTLSLV